MLPTPRANCNALLIACRGRRFRPHSKVLPPRPYITATQLCRYRHRSGDPPDHFDNWHIDEIPGRADGSTYKVLSVVVFLSNPSDYQGGAFELQEGKGSDAVVTALRPPAGTAIVFGAQHMLHRVRPVTGGARCTLVAWACSRDVSRDYEQCYDMSALLSPAPAVLDADAARAQKKRAK